MLEQKKMEELRQHARYRLDRSGYVVVSNRCIKCSILDISMGGVSFQCRFKGEVPDKVKEVDIVVEDDGFRLERIPYRNISDCFRVDGGFTPIRRKSGQFLDLEHGHAEQLREFISRYARR